MSDRLVCKPSPWFLLRAVAMLAMFGIFAVLFFVDAKWGYKEKNLAYFTHQAFDRAFKSLPEFGTDAESWKTFASKQTVDLGNDPGLLPEGVTQPMPWPKQLQDYDKVKAATGNWRPLFDEYRLEAGIKREPDEHLQDKQKILEQWVVFGLSTALVIATAFVLVRTMGRTMAVDDTTFYPAGGAPIPISELSRLDLRKWDTKGVAFTWAKNPDGPDRKIRIDGFVYGGFKKDQGEPAEAFMKRLKAAFSGEIVQYVAEETPPVEVPSPEA